MTSQQPQKRRNKRQPSKEMQRVYLRRRIVVGVVALVLLALIGFGIYALATKVIATYGGHGGQSASSSVSSNHKKAPAKKTEKSDNDKNNQANQSGVRKCGAKDVKLELSPASQSVELGGSLDFKATIRYEGSDSCVVDASNASRILTISSISDAGSGASSNSGSGSDGGNGSGAKSGSNSKSGSKSGSSSKTNSDSDDDSDADQTSNADTGDTIWSSAACPADPRNLLMAKGDKDVQKITWPADKTGATCVPDDQLPRVRRGTYLAQLSLKGHPGVKSEKVPVIVK
ncbi:hypothetical protein OZX67_02000 [Bifidobacterium sp. ESL0728]|uniref:hypothetical protein n=1 Tax=Bifidobacterium sp. ESL0728 TaxID=2983220 RepID=UPI0023F64C88|nr:hypothetical protein [Bifidobacterium sp. ESL0728]WEV59361.1 hypothetical protein OZX67_02000 [Bifidobacterium sp. ESL0728]